MNKETLYLALEEEKDEFISFWKQICSMETPSSDKPALDAQTEFIASFCRDHALQATIKPFKTAGNALIVELPGEKDLAPVLLLAHMDTVHPKGAFGNPPLTEKDGILHGPGVYDCKGGIVIGLAVMNSIRASGIPHRTIRFVLNSDEESGKHIGTAIYPLIAQAGEGCIACFNCEVGIKDFLTVGRKGVLTGRVNIQGIASHAGNAYFAGASAIREAAYKIIAIESESKPNDITYNCGLISGGSASNAVPDNCSFSVDCRLSTIVDGEKAVNIIQRIVDTCYVEGTKSTFLIENNRPPMECTEGNLALFEQINGIAKANGLGEFKARVAGGGSDSAYSVIAGIPTVCSMGIFGGNEHTTREHAVIDSLIPRAKLVALSILEVQ